MNLRQRFSLLFAERGFGRAILVLAGGTTIAQAIVFLASPILTRLYTPEDFGVLAVFAAILGLLTVVASFRYELAIPLPRTNGVAANILALSCLCVVLVAGVSAAVLFFARHEMADLLGAPELATSYWVIPVGVALVGVYQCFTLWAVRIKAFRTIAQSRLQQSIGGVGGQLGLGVAGMGPLGLIVGQLLGQCFGLVGLGKIAIHRGHFILRHVQWMRMVAAARRYSRFPKYSSLEGLANSASIQLPMLLLAAYFLPSTVGHFLLALRVLQMPLSLIGGAVSQVYFSRATEALRAGTLDVLTLKVFRGLVIGGVAPLAVVGLFAPNLFAWIFGEPWRAAGEFAQWMVPWLIAQFVFSPISVLTTVLERQSAGFYVQLIFLVSRNGMLILGSALGAAEGAIGAYSITSFILYCGYGAWLMRIASSPVHKWLPIILCNCAIGGVIIGLMGSI
jgi:O-antigen/teichoic acid export membrane protein